MNRRMNIVARGCDPGLIMNPATRDMLLGLHQGSEGKAAIVKGRPYPIVAREKLCRRDEDPKGDLGIKTDCLFAAVVAAGTQVKRNARSGFSNARSSVLGGRMSFDRDFLEFLPDSLQTDGTEEGEGWIVDVRRGRIPNIGTAVCIVRPRLPKWAIKFSITYDPKLLPDDKAFSLVEIAGRDIGLGDFRVACKGRYGRFEIVECRLEDVPTSETGRVTWDMVQAAHADLLRNIKAAGTQSEPVGDGDDEPLVEDGEENDGENDGNGDGVK